MDSARYNLPIRRKEGVSMVTVEVVGARLRGDRQRTARLVQVLATTVGGQEYLEGGVRGGSRLNHERNRRRSH